jgi:hypothetical protein
MFSNVELTDTSTVIGHYYLGMRKDTLSCGFA